MKKKVIIFFIIVCLVLIIVFAFYQKNKNKALEYELDKSIDEKQETIMIEGLEETITTLKYNSSLGYSMRYDKEYFNVSKNEGMDVYSTENSAVYMIVKKYYTTYEQAVDSLKTEGIILKETHINGNNAVKYSKNVEEILETYYYIQAQNNIYIISIYYPNTTEYTEGLTNRIEKMIQTFEIQIK